MDCPKCEEHFTASEGVTPTNMQVILTIFKDWKLWLFSLALTLIAGATAGGLNLPVSGFMAGTGAVMGIIIAIRMRTVRKCPKCSAIFQSAPFFGRQNADHSKSPS